MIINFDTYEEGDRIAFLEFLGDLVKKYFFKNFANVEGKFEFLNILKPNPS